MIKKLIWIIMIKDKVILELMYLNLKWNHF